MDVLTDVRMVNIGTECTMAMGGRGRVGRAIPIQLSLSAGVVSAKEELNLARKSRRAVS